MPKQPRRATIDAIAEPAGNSPSAVVEESQAVPMANSPANSAATPGPPPMICSINTVQVNDVSAGSPNSDTEGVHTSEDLVPVTPSLLMDNSQDELQISAGITTPVDVFLKAVDKEGSDGGTEPAVSSEGPESVVPTEDMIINEVWNE